MVFLGLDPGVLGGIAAIGEDGRPLAVKMPGTDMDIITAIRTMRSGVTNANVRAVLERVSSSPQMGVSSAFTFGGIYRALRMALTAEGIPFDEVSPLKWQRVMGCLTGGDKNVSKQRAQQLFPSMKMTHYVADAILLAEYGRRVA